MSRAHSEPHPTATQYVSTAQVAQALGVSVTTVKRWVDDHVLPAHRTAGGHRKLLMADVLRLVRDGNLPQADLSKLMPKGSTVQSDAYAIFKQMQDAIARTDTELIRGIIHGAYHAGASVEALADRVIAPALFTVGHDWSVDKIPVLQEHRVTQACVSAFYELRSFLRINAGQGRPVAVGGAPEHDHYVLPTLLAKLTLLDAGWDAINLGPHTPIEAFRDAVERLSPQLIWISVTNLINAEHWLAEYREFYQLCESKGVAVAVGGRALADPIRVKMPYTTFGDGMTQLAAFARTLYRRPQPPKRGRPAGGASRAVSEVEPGASGIG